MATVGLYGSTASSTVASPSGSESVGLYGNNTVFGGSYFEWFIFQVSETQPSTPTGGSWDFTTNTGTPPTGWLASPPVSPTNTVWVSIGLVNSKSTVAITWSVPGKFSFSSGLPILSGTATPLPGDGQTDQLYIQTSTTPETIWFKQAGTWTRLTGSTLYADLTSNQTLAGIKTFSSPIAGSVTGTSANVTGIVSITNGGTGTTSANSAFNALAPSQTGNSGKYLTTDGSNTSWATNPLGTVTSVDVSGGTTGLTTSGGPITSSGTITLAGTLALANGGTGATTAAGARTNLGATTVGSNIFTLANPSAITFPRFNADNTVSSLDAATFRTAIGAGTSSTTGTVTSVAASVPAFLSISGSPITASGTLAIGLSGTALPVANGGTGVTTSTGTGSVVLNTGASLGSAIVSDYETFTSVAAPTYTEGRLWYDSTQKALTYNSDISGNSLHVGQETQLKVRNGTGSTIAKGSPVYITSTATGVSFPNIALAKADTLTTGNCIGLTNEAIASGADGYVVINGILNGVNTGTFTVGDVLYVSPYSAGQLMNTFPPTGYPVKIGVVSFVNSSTGSIYINQSNAFVQASSVIGTLAIANGGTGATTATAAFNALAPTQTGNSGKYLTTDGTNTSWATNPLGTVTSVGGTGTVNGLTLTGTVTTSGNLTLGGTLDLSSPPAIGATAANTGAFTTLSASSTVTLSGGTANGVAYLNGSKVLTTGSALTFSGTALGVGISTPAYGNVEVLGTTNLTGVSVSSATSSPYSVRMFLDTTAGTANIYTHKVGAGLGYPLAFSIDGTEQMRLTSTGLGIGTSSPTQKLQVVATTATTNLTSSTGTNQAYHQVTNTSGNMYLGINNSTNSFFSSAAYAGVVWHDGAYPLVFGTNNTERARIDSSGNLGLGVTPSAWNSSRRALQIGQSTALYSFSTSQSILGTNVYMDTGGTDRYINSAAATQYVQSGGIHSWNLAASGTAGDPITFTQAMTLDASGNLRLGLTGSIITSTERMSIQSASGSVGLAINAAGASSYGIGIYGSQASGATSQTMILFQNSSSATVGSITSNGTATAYNVASDQRLKENIVDAPEFGSIIDTLQVRSFDWKTDQTHQRAGFIAQELVTVAPEAVHQPADPEEMMAVDYSKLVPMLVKEIQSLRKRLADAGIA